MKAFSEPAQRIVASFQARVATERGAAMVEYALLIALIATVAFVAVATFGQALGDKNQGIAGSIQSATN